MKVLITGSNGYIGKSLGFFLGDRFDVVSISREDFDLSSSKETSSFFEGKYFDVIIHCSVSGGLRLKKDSWEVMDNNIKMYYNLLDQRKNFKKLIHFGSGAEFNSLDSPYGLSKKVISKSISEIDNFYNLRLYAIFDQNELETRFIKTSLIKYLNRQPIDVLDHKLMGFFYMEDLVSLVEYYIDNSNPPKEIDCVYNNNYTLLEIAEKINNLESHKVPIIFKGESPIINYCGNFIDLGIKYLGIDEGIKRTYNKLKK